MVATPTTDLRLKKPASGDDVNTWWSDLNTNFDLLDFAITGWTDVALSGNISLSSNNYVADQARSAALHFTGTGAFTVTVPGVAKTYVVWNACTGVTTITNGSSSIAIQVGEVCLVATDGASNFVRVAPSIFPNPVTFGSTASFGGAVDLGGHQAVNAADPTTAQALVTRNYADNLAFTANAGILPGQASNAGGVLTTNATVASWLSPTGSAGKFLTNSGSAISWAYAGFSGQSAKAANYAIVPADREKLIRCTGSFTLTIGAASGFDASFGVYIRNEGAGSITMLGSSATMDGLSTYIMYPGETRLFSNDGANWQSVVLTPFSKTWTTSDAGFVWPPGYQAYEGVGWGGGAGGGTSSNSGGGGAAFPYVIPASAITAGATATVTVAAATAGSGSGVIVAAGNSSIASLITFKGADASGNGGAAGAISLSAYDGAAGRVSTTGAGISAFYGGAAGGTGANAGGTSIFGGAGGAGSTSAAAGNGSAPGGGGGGCSGTIGGGNAGGSGARGEVRMWGIV